MRRCENCGVYVRGAFPRCPLCRGALSGPPCPQEEVFPPLNEGRRRLRTALRVGAFLSLAAALICAAVDLLIPPATFWSVYVAAGLATGWLLVAIALRRRRNIPKTILQLTVLCGALCCGWDAATGWRGWSVTYVTPILCTGAMLALLLLPQLLRLRFQDYILYLVSDILFAALPFVFAWAGLLGDTRLPSLVCVCSGAVSLAAVLVFRGRELLGELSRRTHL